MTKDTGKPRDFEEMTLALALLAGLIAFLLKLIDYFNNNLILIPDYFQPLIYTLLWILLVELLIILSFLILKGYLISSKNEKKGLKNLANSFFKISFSTFIVWFISLIMSLFFYQYIFKNTITKPYYIGISIIYITLSTLLLLGIFIYLMDYKKKDLFESPKVDISFFLKSYLILIILIFIFFIVLSPIPSYLLSGSFSIEVFPQPNLENNPLTVIIRETGISYNISFITLFKLNPANNSLEQIDNITIPKENRSIKELMYGGRYRKDFYLNINTSNLSSGNYMLSAEVTNDPSRDYIFGVIIKHGDKLFYVASKTTNNSFNPN